MIDLTVMGDRKPSMALLDHRGAGVFRAPSERSFGDLALASYAAQQQQQQQQQGALAPPLPLAGLMPPPAPYQSKLQQRAAKRARRSRGSNLGPGVAASAPLPVVQVPRPLPSVSRALTADGSACPHASPQEMHGPKGVPHGEADYTDAVRLLKPNEDIFWELMRNFE